MVAYRSVASFFYIPTVEARTEFGPRLPILASEAFRALARAGKGLEVAHLQFRHGGDLVAVSSRVRRSGEIELEIGVGNPHLPAVVFTEQEVRDADRHSGRPAPSSGGRSRRTVFHLSR